MKFLAFFFIVIWKILLQAWTTPKTWSSEPLTSTDLNAYVRDNQAFFKSVLDNNDSYTADEGSDYSTTSSSFADVDGTNLSLTITTNGQVVYVGFVGFARASGSGTAKIYFNVDVDGSDYFSDDGIAQLAYNQEYESVSFVVPITGLSAGSHTFKLRWKTNQTATLYASNAVEDVRPMFWVQEI
jgi:hypothetical protein